MLNSNEDAMEFIDYATYVVVWFLGAVYGWYARERHAKRTIDRFFSGVEETIDEQVNDSVIPIKIDRHSGVFYVYNKDTEEFMGQGNTRKDLEFNLAKRFPDKKFAADKESLKVLHESL
jgi:hypothetical protein